MITYKRSAIGQGAEAGCGVLGAMAFLGMAVAVGSGLLTADPMIRIAGALGFGFFGLLLGSGSVAALARGSDARVIEIGPGDVWLPGMGRLPWSEVAEVRLEAIRGVGASRAPVTARMRRLGFVPRDPTIRPDTATRVASLLTGGYVRFLQRLAPGARVGGEETAPFGVMELEIPDRFEELLAEVRRHVTVVDAEERRARERAPRWAAGSTIDAEPTATDISIIDAGLARPSPSSAAAPLAPVAGSAPAVSPGSHVLATSTPPGPPSATFSLPAVTLLDLVIAFVPMISLIPATALLLPMIRGGGLSAAPWLVVLGILAAAIFVPWLRDVVRLIGRLRQGRGGTERLRIGPEGVWVAGAKMRPWNTVGKVRTERAGFVRRLGASPIERWRLVFVPARGGPMDAPLAVTSDQLDAPFDDVLDLVRYYHAVEEAG